MTEKKVVYEFAINVKVYDSGGVEVETPKEFCKDAKIDIESAVEMAVKHVITEYETVFSDDGSMYNKSFSVPNNLFKK